MSKVLSVTPAQPGWFSVFNRGPNEEDPYRQRVVLWAVVEDEDDPTARWVTSYSVAEGDAATFLHTDEEDAGFGGYEYLGADDHPLPASG